MKFPCTARQYLDENGANRLDKADSRADRDKTAATHLLLESDEICLRLVDGIGVSWNGLLASWRAKILNDAISKHDARGNHQTNWTEKYQSLGNDDWTVREAYWRSLPGIRRLCLIQPLKVKKEKSEEKGSELKGPAMEWFLPLMEKSMRQIKLFEREGCAGKNSGNKKDGFSEQYSEINIDQDDGFRVWTITGLDNHDAIFKRFYAVRKEWREENKGKRDPFFLFLIDTPCQNSGNDLGDVLRHIYCKAGGEERKKTLPLLRSLPCELGIQGGIVGLEGMAVLREFHADSCQPDLEVGGNDLFWGGAAWLAWVITLFQRNIAETCATDADTFINSMKQDASALDKGTSFLQRIIELETTWMYPELAKGSELDRLYQLFQGIYDIEKIWEDVGSQSKMIIEFMETQRAKAETQRAKALEKNLRELNVRQTVVGMLAGSFIFLTGFFGMNVSDFTEGNSLKFMSFWVVDMLIIVFSVTVCSITWYLTEAKKMGSNTRHQEKKKSWQGSKKLFLALFYIGFILLAGFAAFDMTKSGQILHAVGLLDGPVKSQINQTTYL